MVCLWSTEDDVGTLRGLRSSRKGQITKLKKDLERAEATNIAVLKKSSLESTQHALDKQYHFYSIIQERILELLRAKKDMAAYDEEEQEGDEQLLYTQGLRDRLCDLFTTIDAYQKVRRVQKKLDLFKSSDSLGDSDMTDKLQELDVLID